MIVTAVNVRNQVQALFNDFYVPTKTLVELGAGKSILANITHFYTKSLDETAVVQDEFGLIWVNNNLFQTQDGPHSQSVLNTIELQIAAVMIERTDIVDQIALVQESLSRTLIDHKVDLERSYEINIESVAEIDLREAANNTRYLATGIMVKLRRAVN